MFRIVTLSSLVTVYSMQVWMSETLKPKLTILCPPGLFITLPNPLLSAFSFLVKMAKCVIFLFYFLIVMGILACFISFFGFFIFYFIYKISCILPK